MRRLTAYSVQPRPDHLPKAPPPTPTKTPAQLARIESRNLCGNGYNPRTSVAPNETIPRVREALEALGTASVRDISEMAGVSYDGASKALFSMVESGEATRARATNYSAYVYTLTEKPSQRDEAEK